MVVDVGLGRSCYGFGVSHQQLFIVATREVSSWPPFGAPCPRATVGLSSTGVTAVS